MGYALLDQIKVKAKSKNKTIILPESHDDRVLKAAEILTKEKICKVITLGKPTKVNDDAKKLGVDLTGVEIIDHTTHPKFDEFANIYYELRKKKGMTPEQASEVMKRDLVLCGNDASRRIGRWKCCRIICLNCRCNESRNTNSWNAAGNFNCIKFLFDVVQG